jgi:predicted ArsR family transcriptional regulator
VELAAGVSRGGSAGSTVAPVGAATGAPVMTGASVRVARALLSGGPQTAAALATTLELTSTAIRRHLDALVRDGHVQSSDRAPYGPHARAVRRGRGRPAKVFAITSAGRDALDIHTRHGGDYDLLARDALDFIGQIAGDEGILGFAARRAERMVAAYRARVEGPAPMLDRVESLAAALDADGYSASITAVGAGGVQLCQHNCPIAHVAHEFPQFCEAETKAFSDMLGVNVTRLATMAAGSGVCTTHVPTSTPNQFSSANSDQHHQSVVISTSTTTTGVQEDMS